MLNSNKRFFVLQILILVLFALLVTRLFNLQIVDGSKYKAAAGSKNSVNLVEKAPRGEIYDRYGKPLVVNRECYSINLIKTAVSENELNEIIYKLFKVIEKENQMITDSFPVTETDFKFIRFNLHNASAHFYADYAHNEINKAFGFILSCICRFKIS